MGCKIGNGKIIKSNIKTKYSTDLNGKFLFMRHGKTQFNSDHEKNRQINISYIDCHLSSKGIQQVRAKQNIINNLSIEKVYVSPFYRALQTAYILLENHPNLANIPVIVHPKIAEIGGCTHDFIFDIKQNKNDFNMNSKVKFDWNFFDEYTRRLKWDENFFYFEEYDNITDNTKTEIYNNLRELYDNNKEELYQQALEKFAMFRIEYRKKFESIRHEYNRFLEFKNSLKNEHSYTLNDKNQKILIISHSSFIKISTSPGPYLEKNAKAHPSCHPMKNLEIISIFL
jgi:broad specificity phosphatase PhoE